MPIGMPWDDPSVRRLLFELQLKAMQVSISQVAEKAKVNRRTLQHHRAIDPERIPTDPGLIATAVRCAQPLSDKLGNLSPHTKLCLSGVLLWLADEITTRQCFVPKSRPDVRVFLRALGPTGWSRPLRKRMAKDRIIGPLHRFYRFIEWEYTKQGTDPFACDVDRDFTWPLMQIDRFLKPRVGSVPTKRQLGAANRYIRDLLRESQPTGNHGLTSEWMPEGWEESSPWRHLLAGTFEFSESVHWSMHVDRAWKAALFNQRVLGLILWSVTSPDRSSSGKRRTWTRRSAPQWQVAGHQIKSGDWDVAWELHRRLMHGDLLATLVPDQLWP